MRQPIPFRPKAAAESPSSRQNRRQRFIRWLLGGKALSTIARRTCASVLNDDLTGRSAQLAYYFFLSLFPGLVFLSSVLGMIVGSQSQLRQHLLDSFATFLPGSAYILVASTFAEILKASSAGTAALGILFALWSATSGVSAAQDTLNGVYGVKETRPFWKSTLVAVGLTIVVGALALVAIVAFFYGSSLVEWIAKTIGLNPWLTSIWKLAQWPIAILFLSIAAETVYRFAPDRKNARWRWITPGSVIGILGWIGISELFRAYLHYFNRYSVTYGSLGAVIILLLWFYFSGFMLLLGAEINHIVDEVNEDPKRQLPLKSEGRISTA